MKRDDKKLSKQQMKKQKKQRKLQEQLKTKKKQPESQSQQQSQNPDIDLNQIQKEGEDAAAQMDISFLIGEINQQYYHSLKTILLRYGQITKVNNAEVADAILQNQKIGNVSLADDDDDEQDQGQQSEEEDQQDEAEDDEENVYSVLCVLPGKCKVACKIRSTAQKAAEKQKLPEEIMNILKSSATGVIINERLPNLPAFIASSSHEVFKKDMLQLKENQLKTYNQYFSGYLLNVSEIQHQGSDKLQDLIYSKFQDYQMCKRAKIWWLGDRNQTYKKRADMRSLYYLISIGEYFKGVDQIHTYLQ